MKNNQFNLADHKGVLCISKNMYDDLLNYNDSEGIKILFSVFYPSPSNKQQIINIYGEDHYYIEGFSQYFHQHKEGELLQVYSASFITKSEGYKTHTFFDGMKSLEDEITKSTTFIKLDNEK